MPKRTYLKGSILILGSILLFSACSGRKNLREFMREAHAKQTIKQLVATRWCAVPNREGQSVTYNFVQTGQTTNGKGEMATWDTNKAVFTDSAAIQWSVDDVELTWSLDPKTNFRYTMRLSFSEKTKIKTLHWEMMSGGLPGDPARGVWQSCQLQ